MHGVFYKNIEDLGLSKRLTFAFLRSAGLKSETEGFIMACQDGVFNTLVYRRRVMGMEVPDVSCRACRRAPETVMHLLSACPTYAVSAYIQRHNAALRVLYYHLRHSYEIDETPVLPYAPGDIESVVGNEKCLIYWNYSFPTVRQIQANKPRGYTPSIQPLVSSDTTYSSQGCKIGPAALAHPGGKINFPSGVGRGFVRLTT